jgi:diguanylate cyclase (GGDEF)-like protein
MSLRHAITLIVLLGSLLPAYFVGVNLITRHSDYLLEQKQEKVDNAINGIAISTQQEIEKILNLTQWHSKDRVLILGTQNILYSSLIWEKTDDFASLASHITTSFVLDKEWNPVYENNGSLYHLESSQFINRAKQAKSLFEQGLMHHMTFDNEGLIVDGGQQGFAIIAPLLPYTLLEGAQYQPEGYLLVLISLDELEAMSERFLLKGESAKFSYLSQQNVDSQPQEYLKMSIAHDALAAPIQLSIRHYFSDDMRMAEIHSANRQLNFTIVGILILTLILAWTISRWLVNPLRSLEIIFKGYQRGYRPDSALSGYQFKEFKQLLTVVDSLWLKVQTHLDELQVRNEELSIANQRVQATNKKLENFNQNLERSVDAKTQELRSLLVREERYQLHLMSIINFFSERQGMKYRKIPKACNRFLIELISSSKIKFKFAECSCGQCEVIKSAENVHLGSFSYDKEALTDQELILFKIFSRQLIARLELELIARTDKLSNCFNRKAFDDDFDHLSNKLPISNDWCFSVIVIDINGLKPVNDLYGHEYGDELILNTARLITSVLPKRANLYRIGGDEFAILLPELQGRSFDDLVERILSVKDDQYLSINDDKRLPINYSVGFASSTNVSADELFSTADANMYKDKRHFYEN